MLVLVKKGNLDAAKKVIESLKQAGVEWPEIAAFERSLGHRDLEEAKSAPDLAKVMQRHFNKNQMHLIMPMLYHFKIYLDKDPTLHKVIDDNAEKLIKWYDKISKKYTFDDALGDISHLINRGYRAQWVIDYLNAHKRDAIMALLNRMKDESGDGDDLDFVKRVIHKLKKLKLNWPELKVIERSLRAEIQKISENRQTTDDIGENVIKLGSRSEKARAWIEKVYAKFPQTWQNNHVMSMGGTGDDQQFAMFELVPSFNKRDAVEIKWFQAYPMRQGVGSRAMKELQRMAHEDGVALTLYPWDKGQVSQANLIKFYKGTGFKPTAKGAKNMIWSPVSENFADGEISENTAETIKGIADMLRWSFDQIGFTDNTFYPLFKEELKVDDHPELKKVVYDNFPKIVNWITDTLKNGYEDLFTASLSLTWRQLEDIGIEMPNPVLSKLLKKSMGNYKSLLKKLISKGQLFITIDILKELKKWDIEILDQIVDLNDIKIKTQIMKRLLIGIKNDDSRIVQIVRWLRDSGVRWPELDVIERSMRADKQISENFADGKGPGKPGDSARHGIPKGATIAQLEKAAKAPGRKGQLARWQLNMRRGKAKK
jgi:hypothetical protein